MIFFKRAAAMMCAAIFLGMPLSVSAQMSKIQESCPDYSKISREDFDPQSFKNILERLESIAKSGDSEREDEVKKLLAELVKSYTHMQTLRNVYEVGYYADVTDSAALSRYEDISDDVTELFSDMQSCLKRLSASGFDKALSDVDGYDLKELYVSDDNSDDDENKKMVELQKKENDILNEYSRYTNSDFSIEYEGRIYDPDSILEADLDNTSLSEAARLIYEKRSKLLGELFIRLRSVRQEIAKLYGYDNYADYASENFYIRDYDNKDTERSYEGVKKYLAKLDRYAIEEASAAVYGSGLDELEIDTDEAMSILSGFLKNIGGDALENFTHMTQHGLYNIEGGKNRSGGSFTTFIYDYDSPFMFITPSNDYNDIRAVVHEFGHANADYESTPSALYDNIGTSIDTCEMQSQGMQILFMSYSGQELDEDCALAFNKYTVTDMLDSVIQGCLFDEFQKYAYENPSCSLEDLNNKYSELCKEYNVNFSPDDPSATDWTEIDHNFSSPMYYITYATSAFSVLDMWAQSGDDTDKALEIYERIVDSGCYTPYLEACRNCGIADIFDEQAMADISEKILYYFKNNKPDPDLIVREAEAENTVKTESTEESKAVSQPKPVDIPQHSYKTAEEEADRIVRDGLAVYALTYCTGAVIAFIAMRISYRRHKRNGK